MSHNRSDIKSVDPGFPLLLLTLTRTSRGSYHCLVCWQQRNIWIKMIAELGPCKVRNETKKTRNETKQIETKRNKSKRNETDRNETKQIKTKRNKTKRNKSKRNETNDMARHCGQKSILHVYFF